MATAVISFPVIRDGGGGPYVNSASLRTKVTLRQVGGPLAITLPFAPVQTQHSGIGLQFDELERPVWEPFLVASHLKLEKMSFELLVVNDTYRGMSSCEHILAILWHMAGQGLPVVLAYGPLAAKQWMITDLQITSTRRELITNNIARATVAVELTKASPVSASSIPGMPVILDTYGVITKPSATKKSASSRRTTTVTSNPDELARAIAGAVPSIP